MMRGKRFQQRRELLLAVSAALLLISSTALAGRVTGTLRIPPDYDPPAATAEGGPDAFFWEQWNGVVQPAKRRFDLRREVAVVLTGEGSGPENAFRLSGGALMPSTMVARAGKDIRIENTDGFRHELFSEDLAGLSPQPTTPGNARSFPAPAAGHYRIQDRLYAHVQGHLHVLPDLVARAIPSADGQFVFDDVAPGTYRLKVFVGERELSSSEVTVPGSSLTVSPIDLNLGQ